MTERRSWTYENRGGRPYEPKTLAKIKKCLSCGHEFQISKALTKRCCFCGGTLVDKYVMRNWPAGQTQKNR